MHTLIALLRGINVGGKNILPMKELRILLEDLGLEEVRTYIQSGNIAFRTESSDMDTLSRDIRAAINKSHDLSPEILLLPFEELQLAIANNPFPEGESEPKTLHLFFTASAPGAPDWGRLEALKTGAERFRLIDRVFYLHAPDGIGRSRLAANVEKALGVPITARNWRTVNKIMDMAADPAS